jgi:hypothetical protein
MFRRQLQVPLSTEIMVFGGVQPAVGTEKHAVEYIFGACKKKKKKKLSP